MTAMQIELRFIFCFVLSMGFLESSLILLLLKFVRCYHIGAPLLFVERKQTTHCCYMNTSRSDLTTWPLASDQSALVRKYLQPMSLHHQIASSESIESNRREQRVEVAAKANVESVASTSSSGAVFGAAGDVPASIVNALRHPAGISARQIDLDVRNRLVDSGALYPRRAYDTAQSTFTTASLTSSAAAAHPHSSRLAQTVPVAVAADNVVAKYQVRSAEQLQGRAASPDGLRHNLLLQTSARSLFQSASGSAETAVATSPRSWQDHVFRSVDTLKKFAVSSLAAVEQPEQTRPLATVPHQASSGADAVVREPQPCLESAADESDFRDAETGVFTRIADDRTKPTLAVDTDGKSAFAAALVNIALEDKATKILERVHPAPPVAAASDRVDPEIAAGIHSMQVKLDHVKGIMARDALVNLEEISRRQILLRSHAFFRDVFFFFHESEARGRIGSHEAQIRAQLATSRDSVARREAMRGKLFADWAKTESIERKRLESQRELFMAEIEGPWRGLRRRWEPQNEVIENEKVQRDRIKQQAADVFYDLALALTEHLEDFHRRQLVTAILHDEVHPDPASLFRVRCLKWFHDGIAITRVFGGELVPLKHQPPNEQPLIEALQTRATCSETFATDWATFFLPRGQEVKIQPVAVVTQKAANNTQVEERFGSVTISVPCELWASDWIPSPASAHHTPFHLASASYEFEVTVVTYYGYWLPAFSLLLQEQLSRLAIGRHAFFTSSDDSSTELRRIVGWHHDAIRTLKLNEALQSVMEQYISVASFLQKEETLWRAASFGFYAAWRSRCAFMHRLIEAEDESWEAALQQAMKNAANCTTAASRSESVVTLLSTVDTATTASFSGKPGVFSPVVIDYHHPFPFATDTRSSSLLTQTSQAPVPLAMRRNEMPPISVAISGSSAAAAGGDSETSRSRATLLTELFLLADVSATGLVKLPNVAAALRMRQICFDLPHVAKVFQRAAHLYEEMTGHRDEVIRQQQSSSSLSSYTSGSPAINREAFDLMIQILFNDLKAQKLLPAELAERWDYETRHR